LIRWFGLISGERKSFDGQRAASLGVIGGSFDERAGDAVVAETITI